MQMKLDMAGILTTKFAEMKEFYRDALGMEVVFEMSDNYVEFKSPGLRFAISTNEVMHQITQHKSFKEKKQGQAFELAFIVDNPAEVDSSYEELVSKGATAITPPAEMPWGQYAAFFADPDGNIHEIFCNLADSPDSPMQ